MSHAQRLLKARYGQYETGKHAPWDPILESLLFHRSVRAYASAPLPGGTVEDLVAAAQSAASSSNLQIWSVVAIEDTERRKRLSVLCGNQLHIAQAPLFLAWLADFARLCRVAGNHGIAAEGLDYLEMFVMATVDASLAAQNAVVAAESLGLGTVYIGALRNHPERVAAELDLPDGVFPLFGLCVGYADPAVTSVIKPRLPREAVLHRETYALESQDEAIRRYDDIMTAFYAEQKMATPGDWSRQSAQRISGADKLFGRARLREALHALGFALR